MRAKQDALTHVFAQDLQPCRGCCTSLFSCQAATSIPQNLRGMQIYLVLLGAGSLPKHQILVDCTVTVVPATITDLNILYTYQSACKNIGSMNMHNAAGGTESRMKEQQTLTPVILQHKFLGQ